MKSTTRHTTPQAGTRQGITGIMGRGSKEYFSTLSLSSTNQRQAMSPLFWRTLETRPVIPIIASPARHTPKPPCRQSHHCGQSQREGFRAARAVTRHPRRFPQEGHTPPLLAVHNVTRPKGRASCSPAANKPQTRHTRGTGPFRGGCTGVPRQSPEMTLLRTVNLGVLSGDCQALHATDARGGRGEQTFQLAARSSRLKRVYAGAITDQAGVPRDQLAAGKGGSEMKPFRRPERLLSLAILRGILKADF